MSGTTDMLMAPCPFCGSAGEMFGEPKFKANVFRHEESVGGFYIRCSGNDCHCSLGWEEGFPDPGYEVGEFDTEADALSAWNRRAEV